MRVLVMALLVSGTVLTGCTSTPVQNSAPIPELTFAQLKTIPVHVKRIEFKNETQRGATLWDMGNELPTPPDVAMNRYFEKRFKANSADGVLDIILKQAQITVEESPNANKILSYIPFADTEEYTLDILVDMETGYMAGQPNVKTTKRFVRKVQMPLNVTMSYRESRLQRTLEEVMRDVDESIVRTLAYDFNVVDRSYAMAKGMPVLTPLPEKETKVGEYWDKFQDGVNKTVDDIDQRINGTTGAPQPITPVKAEPLND